MVDVKGLIRARLAEKQLSLNEASRRIGRNQAYLNQFLERGVPRVLPEDTRERLEDLLGLNRGALRQIRQSKNVLQNVTLTRMSTTEHYDTIPVLGAVEGGADGWFIWNGEEVERRSRPPELATAKQGFGLYIVGTSMEPRYHEGEVVYVNPGKPVTANCYVVVQLKPLQDGEAPRALVKRYVKRSGDRLILHQLSPDKEIEISMDEVVSIHRIVGSGE
jgi:phage repressor protein C with HTH and peptisase S24 domain